MVTSNLKIDLDPREDKENQIYYLGKLRFPGRIQCDNGVAFLIFVAEDDSEELQIATIDKQHTTYSKYTKKPDRLNVSIEPREDQFKKVFYVAKIQFHGYIDCASEVVFIIFNSKEGSEELQIVGNVVLNRDEIK